MSSADLQQQLDAWRRAGAHRFDPVRFRYMEVLARRAQEQGEKVQGILEGRLARALADWSARYENAQAMASTDAAAAAPDAVAPGPLALLLRDLAQHAHGQSDANADAERTLTDSVRVRPELKSVRDFRDSWSRLSADQQVRQSMGQAPKNAGPLNSHMLALRSLGLMREISPDYLNRFVSYADTLLCLELRESEPVASSTGADSKRPKARRSRARPDPSAS